MNNIERRATEELMRLLRDDIRSPVDRMLHVYGRGAESANVEDLYDLVLRAGFVLQHSGLGPVPTSWLENGERKEGVGG